MTHENSVSRRYLALVFPWLPIERLRATRPHLFVGRAEAPVAFVETVAGGIRIKALDRDAVRAGLTIGLTLADARARIPALEVHPHDLHADHDWLERLADGCVRYTPSVALDPPDGLILDIAGCAHAFEGERRLAADVEERLARRGLLVIHAFADTPDAARALARYAGAPAPDEKRAIKRLPVAALGLDAEATTALTRAGLKTVGDVMARPLAGIAARFGEEAATMIRRLTGEVKGPLTPRRLVPKIGVERRFAEPIARTEFALEVLAELATEAAALLAERHEGGRRWEARLFRADGLVQSLRIETGQPTRDVASLMRLFRERIDGLADALDPGFGYDLVRLDVALAERLDATQLKLEGGTAITDAATGAVTGAVAELVDRLSTRLGRSRVRRFAPRDSHIPEQAELMLPAAAPRTAGAWPLPAAGEPPLRPIYLFDPPQPIDLVVSEVPDGPPQRFRWRRDNHEVARAEGPERIAGEWWRRHDRTAPTRDYYRVEDQRGRRFWIFRHGLYDETDAPRWYLHGLFRVSRLTPDGRVSRLAQDGRASGFAELVAATNYSFLHGASHPQHMVAQALALGQAGIGIADRNTVAGVVRAYVALNESRELSIALGRGDPVFKLVVGARLVFADGTPDIVAYPATRFGWGRLTRLLTLGNRRAEKGGCILGLGDLLRHGEEQMLIVLPDSSPSVATPVKDVLLPPPRTDTSLATTLALVTAAAAGRVWLGVTMPRAGSDRRRFATLGRIADAAGVPVLATCDALYADADDRPLHDIVTCIREGVTVHKAGRLLAANAERHLKPPEEMARLFRDRADALAESLKLLDRIDFTLDDLKYEYPHEPVPDGWNPQDWLEHLAWQSTIDHYDGYVPEKLIKLIQEEFKLIREQNYAYYFLTVHDIVRFARSVDPPILCQGRGSAANSVVCFVLGVTSVDPMWYDLLFSRFVSSERHEPPDIDVDFEHERREEVMQYIYRRYGRDRAAIAATVIHYRPRSAVREVGKALGLSEDVTQRLTSTVWGSFANRFEEKRFTETGFTLDNPEIARLGSLVDRLLEFPRHLSQHVGGYVLTHDRLDETVPIHNGAMADRTFIEWDKDDIDALKLMKVDILALGMLTCIRKAFDLMRDHGLGDHALETIANDESPAVYDMLCKGDSIGVFQVESRAQINMLPRLRPRKLYDLVVQVAIVRPGPIEGDMVHPYLRRRAQKEAVDYPSPSPEHGPADELKTLLGETFGVPLFQEQAMKLAIVAAKFTPEEANQLRRAMATFRNVGTISNFEHKMVEGMAARGYQRDFAERCFKQIEGFGSYGFPESHALSFARLVYVSSWIKCFHPAVFACALLNSQPMGFYAPAQIVRDAIEHDVEVRAIDVNASGWDNGLEPSGDGDFAMRLGFRQIDGFRDEWATTLVGARALPFASIEDLARRATLPQRALRLLADADAFRSIDKDRREALWDVRRTPPRQLALFAAADVPELGAEQDAHLPAMPLSEHVAADYQTTRLSLKDHPMTFLRPLFRAEGILSSAEAARAKDGARARVAGVVLVRQRPGKGNAIFVTIEDETGITNGLMWARDFEANRRDVMAARLMVLDGVIQRSAEGVTHLMTTRVRDRSHELARLSSDHLVSPPLSRSDEVVRPQPIRSRDPRQGRSPPDPRPHHPRDVRIMPKSRDFH